MIALVVLNCTLVDADSGLLRCVAQNKSDAPIHVFDSSRLPYLIEQKDRSLLVLHGLHAPDPHTSYMIINIPPTQAVAPGAEFTFEIGLRDTPWTDHYTRSAKETGLGERLVIPRLAWLPEPIPEDKVGEITIHRVVEAQQLVEAPPIKVDLP
jgi:hypothetical protein